MYISQLIAHIHCITAFFLIWEYPSPRSVNDYLFTDSCSATNVLYILSVCIAEIFIEVTDFVTTANMKLESIGY